MKNKALAIAMAVALSGCSSPPFAELQAKLKELAFALFASRGEAALSAALKHYEDGNYAEAEKSFRSALDQGLPPAEAGMAHKHLAFIHCAAERTQECRTEFQLALRVDPKTDLDPAEAGHPAWGPVFRSLAR